MSPYKSAAAAAELKLSRRLIYARIGFQLLPHYHNRREPYNMLVYYGFYAPTVKVPKCESRRLQKGAASLVLKIFRKLR